jgi:vanillate O-demethylase monooxygenase subunit
MYPLDVAQPYPRNQWYVGAYSHEVSRDILERTLMDQLVVFYRTAAGEAVAMQGLCPHRFYPLVKGALIGDSIQCGYHGLVFGPQGRCETIPSQADVPARCSLLTYPVAEKAGLLWIWMGPDAADPAKIPSPACFNTAEYEFTLSNYRHVKSRYLLLIENLFDLSHVDFLHSKTIPPSRLSEIPLQLIEHEGNFRTVRETRGAPYDGYATLLFGPGEGVIDFDAPTDYYGPCLTVTGSVHNRRSGHGHAEGGGAMRNVHCLTPETEHTTHYFGGFSRNFRKGDAAFTRIYQGLDDAVRLEDVGGLADIELNLERFANVKAELSIRADAGGIRVRRLLSEQIRSEMTVA